MRCRNVVASLLIVAFTAGLTLSNTLVAQNQVALSSDRLKSLKQEYINTLQSRVEAVESRYKSRHVATAAALSVRIDLLDAELEFATTRNQRVEILKRKVETSSGEGELCQGGTQERLAGFQSGGCPFGNGRTVASGDCSSVRARQGGVN